MIMRGLCQDAKPLGISAKVGFRDSIHSSSISKSQHFLITPISPQVLSASSSSEVPGGVSMIRASSSPQVTSVKNCLMRPFLKDLPRSMRRWMWLRTGRGKMLQSPRMPCLFSFYIMLYHVDPLFIKKMMIKNWILGLSQNEYQMHLSDFGLKFWRRENACCDVPARLVMSCKKLEVEFLLQKWWDLYMSTLSIMWCWYCQYSFDSTDKEYVFFWGGKTGTLCAFNTWKITVFNR